MFMFQGSGKWYEMQDLHVIDILPQMITLTEAYIQVSSKLLIIRIIYFYYLFFHRRPNHKLCFFFPVGLSSLTLHFQQVL